MDIESHSRFCCSSIRKSWYGIRLWLWSCDKQSFSYFWIMLLFSTTGRQKRRSARYDWWISVNYYYNFSFVAMVDDVVIGKHQSIVVMLFGSQSGVIVSYEEIGVSFELTRSRVDRKNGMNIRLEDMFSCFRTSIGSKSLSTTTDWEFICIYLISGCHRLVFCSSKVRFWPRKLSPTARSQRQPSVECGLRTTTISISLVSRSTGTVWWFILWVRSHRRDQLLLVLYFCSGISACYSWCQFFLIRCNRFRWTRRSMFIFDWAMQTCSVSCTLVHHTNSRYAVFRNLQICQRLI